MGPQSSVIVNMTDEVVFAMVKTEKDWTSRRIQSKGSVGKEWTSVYEQRRLCGCWRHARVWMGVLVSQLARMELLSVKDAFRRKQRVRKLVSNRSENFFNARKRGLMVRIGKRSERDCGQELVYVLFAMSAGDCTSIGTGN